MDPTLEICAYPFHVWRSGLRVRSCFTVVAQNMNKLPV